MYTEPYRSEFLTGFRKRKLQKKEAAKGKAKERERQERLEARKENRQALKEQAEENARLVESAWKEGMMSSTLKESYPSDSDTCVVFVKAVTDADTDDENPTESLSSDRRQLQCGMQNFSVQRIQ